MADKPAAERSIDEALVRALLIEQAGAVVPGVGTATLTHAEDGWDCSVWRLGDRWAVRLPRRELAAPLVRHEQAVLGDIAARIVATGVGVPAPVLAGQPGHGYPWSWSVVPWFEGSTGLSVPLRERRGWAGRLADALGALHMPAPDDHPVNPVRGVPLRQRADAVAVRFESLRGRADPDALSRAHAAWRAALEVEPWRRGPVWVHGDLHPGNLVVVGGELVAIIDFGDVTGGDPAYDLAVAWLAFDAPGRRAFIAATGSRYDGATWVRARGWAAAVAAILLDQSDDNPDYARLGSDALQELLN